MTAKLKTILIPTYFIVSVLILYSCQKEIDAKILNKVSSNPCVSDLLVKIVSRTGKDSLIYTFEYDGANRMIRQVITSFSQQNPVSSDRKIIRDSQGIITQIVDKSDNTADSAVVNVFHNSITGRYTYTTQEFYPYGLLIKDSIVFFYDASGKIVEKDVYLDHFTNGAYLTLDDRYEYIYDGAGNVTMEKGYDRDQATNVMLFESTFEYSYDNKKNAQRFDMGEAFVIYDPSSISAHNRTLTKVTDFLYPIYNATYTQQYTYNSCDKPIASIQTQNPGNIISNISFYYR
jgi:hypothetical protein